MRVKKKHTHKHTHKKGEDVLHTNDATTNDDDDARESVAVGYLPTIEVVEPTLKRINIDGAASLISVNH